MTTTTTQEAFLRDFHSRHPAVTARTLGAGRAPDGRSSYEVLAGLVAGCGRVLDLGCGDGPLLEVLARTRGTRTTGLDLSPEALALARRRPAPAGARVVEGRAQQLPISRGSFDAVASHMALMLMGDVEQVAAEAARVLVPGGVLACAVGGGAAGGEAYELFVALLRATLGDAPPDQRIPALGDRRTRTREGFDAVFVPAGFAPSGWRTVPIDLGGSAEQVWSTVSGVYDLAPLDEAAVAGLRTAFLTEAAALAGPDGRVPCAFTMHFVTSCLA